MFKIEQGENGHAYLKVLDEDGLDYEVEKSASVLLTFSPVEGLLLEALNILAQELKETRVELDGFKGRMAALDAAFPDGVSWGR